MHTKEEVLRCLQAGEISVEEASKIVASLPTAQVFSTHRENSVDVHPPTVEALTSLIVGSCPRPKVERLTEILGGRRYVSSEDMLNDCLSFLEGGSLNEQALAASQFRDACGVARSQRSGYLQQIIETLEQDAYQGDRAIAPIQERRRQEKGAPKPHSTTPTRIAGTVTPMTREQAVVLDCLKRSEEAMGVTLLSVKTRIPCRRLAEGILPELIRRGVLEMRGPEKAPRFSLIKEC